MTRAIIRGEMEQLSHQRDIDFLVLPKISSSKFILIRVQAEFMALLLLQSLQPLLVAQNMRAFLGHYLLESHK